MVPFDMPKNHRRGASRTASGAYHLVPGIESGDGLPSRNDCVTERRAQWWPCVCSFVAGVLLTTICFGLFRTNLESGNDGSLERTVLRTPVPSSTDLQLS